MINTQTRNSALYIKSIKKKVKYLFESNWNKPYFERDIRKILMTYTKPTNMNHTITPHKLRHFLFTWMKKQGIDGALIQYWPRGLHIICNFNCDTKYAKSRHPQ